jgi:hypothetical protein
MKIYRVYENVQGGCNVDECDQRFCVQETRSYHNNKKGALSAIADMIKIKVEKAMKERIMGPHNLYNLRSNRTSIRVGHCNSTFSSYPRYEIEELDVIETVDNGMPIYYNQYGLYDGH